MNEYIKTRTRYVLNGGDYSQQEPKLMTHLSQDSGLIDTYANKKDLYATIVSKIFKKNYWDCMEHFEDGSYNPEGKKIRHIGKCLVLGIMYGMGAKLMASNIGVPIEECKNILEEFFKLFPKVKDFINANEDKAKKLGYVEDYMGRRRHLPDISLPPLEFKVNRRELTEPDCLLENIPSYIEVEDIEGSKYWNDLYKAVMSQGYVSFDKKNEFKQKAQEAGVIVKDNGGFISKATTQCTNAVIQRCIEGDTKLIVKDKGVVPIKELVGQHIYLWDGNEYTNGDVVYSGKKQKCIITFINNQKFICSPTHKFKVGCKFKECKNLLPRDKVAIDTNFIESTDTYNSVKSVEITNEYIDMYDVCDTGKGYYIADGLVVHNSAATLTKKAMLKIFNDKRMQEMGFRILVPVHDELLGEVPLYYAEECATRLAQDMVEAAKPECTIPMKVDTYTVKHWYSDEVAGTIRNSFIEYTKGNPKKNIAPVSEEEALEKLYKEYEMLSPKTIKEMAYEQFDLIEGDI